MPIYLAVPDNLEDIMELASIWDTEEENDVATSIEKLYQYIEDEVIYIYVNDEDEILGLMILEDDYNYYTLKTIYVHPDCRSEGIGTEMLRKFTHILDVDLKGAFLEVEKQSEAVSLYERFNFKESNVKGLPVNHIAMIREPRIS